jgi:2,3-bisphosphoglycerate-independent phosphoglycerate mutase
VEAITKTDAAVGTIYEACKEAGYILLITADHGNAEQMINLETGAPHTAHTTNPVPFIMTADPAKYHFSEDKPGDDEEPGALCDVAPTVLELLVRRCLLTSLFPLAELTMPFSHLRQGLPQPQGTPILLASVD